MLLSVSHELTLQLLQTPPSTRARVIVGYAGWGPASSNRRSPSSAWLTTDVDPTLIFGVPADQMWETAIRRLGADPAALQIELRRPLVDGACRLRDSDDTLANVCMAV